MARGPDMLDHLQRSPSGKTTRSGGEGGNRGVTLGPSSLLVVALLFSALFVALATAALR
jgi:hypothetical protein